MKQVRLLHITLSILLFFSYQSVFAATLQELRDSAINAQVVRNIKNKDVMAGTNVIVTTNYGIVRLQGHVDTQEQATAAISAAIAIDGVKGVDARGLDIHSGANDTNRMRFDSVPR